MWCCWLEVLPEVPIARVAAAAAAAAAMMLVARTPAHPCVWWWQRWCGAAGSNSGLR